MIPQEDIHASKRVSYIKMVLNEPTCPGFRLDMGECVAWRSLVPGGCEAVAELDVGDVVAGGDGDASVCYDPIQLVPVHAGRKTRLK